MRVKRRLRLLWLAGRDGRLFPWDVLCAKADVLAVIGLWDKAMSIYDRCLPRLEGPGNETAQERCFSYQGHILMLQGRYEEAGLRAERALELSRSIGDKPGQAKALNLLGNIANNQGRLDRAVDWYLGALSDDITEHGAVDRCVVLKNLGVAYYEQGNYKDSTACLKKALSYAEDEGRLSEVGAIYLNLGIIFQRQQNYQPALDYLRQSLEILHRVGFLHLEKNVHNYFGIIYNNLGKIDQALEHYQFALKYSRELGDQQGMATVYNNLGNIHLDRGNYQKASEHFQECLVLCREMRHETGIAVASFNLGEISKELGHLDKADMLFSGTIDYARKNKAKYLLCQFLAGLADLRMRQGRNLESAEMAGEAIALAEELNLTSVNRSCRLLMARMTAASDLASALAQMEMLLAECDDDSDRAEINYLIFKLTGNSTRRQTALECYRRLNADPENLLIRQKIAELSQE
jgi:tetratricopeptide (TPR) repeat protein